MKNPSLLLLLLVAVGCIALPFSVFCSRRRIFETWAKVVSILLCVFGLSWSALAFSLIHFEDSAADPLKVALSSVRTLLGGICIGLSLGMLIARPYKKVPNEEPQKLV